MEFAMILALLLSAGPALVLFYYVLRKYTYPIVEDPFFKDSTVISLLAVGLVEGFLIAAFYTMFDWTNPLFGMAFALVQTFAILLVLNLRRFHGKSDTVFYGFALGLGQGAGMSYGMFSLMFNASGSLSSMDAYSWMTGIAFLIMQLLLMSSIGANIGEGVARLRIGEFSMQALMLSLAGMILWSFTAMMARDENLLWIVTVILMAAMAIYYYYRTIYTGLSKVVADVIKLEGGKRKDIPR